MLRYILLFIWPFMITSESSAQTVIPLYQGKIPNSVDAADQEKSDTSKTNGRIGISKVSNPTLRVYLPHYSGESQVAKDTPPTFLVHAQDDKTVKVDNSIYFYQSLSRKGIPAEMHLYPKGGHGFGLINPTSRDLWMEHCRNWMIANNWIKP